MGRPFLPFIHSLFLWVFGKFPMCEAFAADAYQLSLVSCSVESRTLVGNYRLTERASWPVMFSRFMNQLANAFSQHLKQSADGRPDL
jgi:hypothetical protein